ncbi:DASH family cryptochrome [bacterium]|nr:DASH family cryptochrome [bacterium]
MNETAIVWFRNDLRLTDHEPLMRALRNRPNHLVLVYCIDPQQFEKTGLCGFPKTGPHRARFLIESLESLRNQLQSLGNDLFVTIGRPEEVLPDLASQVRASRILFHEEATDEEIRVERAVTNATKDRAIALEPYWGSTLFHRDDLPFEVDRLPNVFTQFRIRCEQATKVRSPLSRPTQLPPPPPGLQFRRLPELKELGIVDPPEDSRAVMRFHGGEPAATARLDAWFWREDRLRNYKLTRNGLLGADYSSKFSPWLSLGCISPRTIAAEVARYEETRVRNDSTYWLVFELMWRDYFRFLALQAGNSLFARNGPAGVSKTWSTDRGALQRWIDGRTGIPFVDANMRELKSTGFMSNRGRQNVASFLAKDLNIDWRFGAEWFESQLIDYDVCANWGNWSYVAGVGNDPRQDRRFNVVKQAHDYDPRGEYVRTWLPELALVPDPYVHEPWRRSDANRLPLDFGEDGLSDYPPPMIGIDRFDPGSSSRHLAEKDGRKRK